LVSLLLAAPTAAGRGFWVKPQTRSGGPQLRQCGFAAKTPCSLSLAGATRAAKLSGDAPASREIR